MDNNSTPKSPQVGDAIVYTNPLGQDINALVCSSWAGPNDLYPSINVAYVSTDPGMQDNYGRQLGRASSVTHAKNQSAPGNYWRRPGEARVIAPVPAT